MSLKQQVMQMLSIIDDENLLELVKADIEYFNNKETDIIDDIYYSDKDELLRLANEPDEKIRSLKMNLKKQPEDGVQSNL